jgi:hypothetical protein
VLHDDGARRHLVPMTNVPDLQGNEVASTQFAVNAQVKQRELAYPGSGRGASRCP